MGKKTQMQTGIPGNQNVIFRTGEGTPRSEFNPSWQKMGDFCSGLWVSGREKDHPKAESAHEAKETDKMSVRVC
jgi:hypothetical protein